MSIDRATVKAMYPGLTDQQVGQATKVLQQCGHMRAALEEAISDAEQCNKVLHIVDSLPRIALTSMLNVNRQQAQTRKARN